MSMTLMPFSGPIVHSRLRGPGCGSRSVQLTAAEREAQGRPTYGGMRGQRRLFLLAGFADLEQTVELLVLRADAVGDPRLALLTRCRRGLLDQLSDVVLKDRDAIVERLHR